MTHFVLMSSCNYDVNGLFGKQNSQSAAAKSAPGREVLFCFALFIGVALKYNYNLATQFQNNAVR